MGRLLIKGRGFFVIGGEGRNQDSYCIHVTLSVNINTNLGWPTSMNIFFRNQFADRNFNRIPQTKQWRLKDDSKLEEATKGDYFPTCLLV